MKIKVTCKEATLLMVKHQAHATGLKEKVQMCFHLLICRFCRLFFKQTSLLDEELKTTAINDDLLPEVKMSDEKKSALQEKLRGSS
jgi:hypothetical protein